MESTLLGLGKEEFLAIFLSYGIFTVVFDAPFWGMGIGLGVAMVLSKWKEGKPRAIVYHILRRIFPIEAGVFNTGIDPLDRRIVG